MVLLKIKARKVVYLMMLHITGISPNPMISVIDKIQLPLQINLIGKGNYTPKVKEKHIKTT